MCQHFFYKNPNKEPTCPLQQTADLTDCIWHVARFWTMVDLHWNPRVSPVFCPQNQVCIQLWGPWGLDVCSLLLTGRCFALWVSFSLQIFSLTRTINDNVQILCRPSELLERSPCFCQLISILIIWTDLIIQVVWDHSKYTKTRARTKLKINYFNHMLSLNHKDVFHKLCTGKNDTCSSFL